jgi:hypothetical protein
MNASIGDLDNNGFQDVYVWNIHGKLQAEGSLLWMNSGTADKTGAGAFKDMGMDRMRPMRGVSAGAPASAISFATCMST